jgi:hypothetical protein
MSGMGSSVEFAPGMRVRLKSNGQVGVITRVGVGPLVQCFFGAKMTSLNRSDLEAGIH